MKLTNRSELLQEPQYLNQTDRQSYIMETWSEESLSHHDNFLMWKARKDMGTLGFIFEKKPSVKNTRSNYNGKLCQPSPGHPELTSNKMAQI